MELTALGQQNEFLVMLATAPAWGATILATLFLQIISFATVWIFPIEKDFLIFCAIIEPIILLFGIIYFNKRKFV